MRRARKPSEIGLGLGLGLAAVACQGRLDHEFGAYVYNGALDCLEAPQAVDVIAGADPGSCPMVRCWVAPDSSVYVTDHACDAPPDYTDQTKATSGPCVKALAAYASVGMGLCPGVLDGGTE